MPLITASALSRSARTAASETVVRSKTLWPWLATSWPSSAIRFRIVRAARSAHQPSTKNVVRSPFSLQRVEHRDGRLVPGPDVDDQRDVRAVRVAAHDLVLGDLDGPRRRAGLASAAARAAGAGSASAPARARGRDEQTRHPRRTRAVPGRGMKSTSTIVGPYGTGQRPSPRPEGRCDGRRVSTDAGVVGSTDGQWRASESAEAGDNPTHGRGIDS